MARLQVIKQFYASKQWREIRIKLILQRGCMCEMCGKVFADTSQLIGHHITELTADNINDPNITLNPNNISIACIECHNKESNRFSVKSHDVYVVYGSPLSGKTTTVRQMFRRGDLIIDIDRLWEAATMCPPYDKPNNVKYNIFALRNMLIDQVKTRYGQWNDAYIIGGYPQQHEREQLVPELGASLIYCDSTRDECISRLHADISRSNVVKEWTNYINNWWEKYTL